MNLFLVSMLSISWLLILCIDLNAADSEDCCVNETNTPTLCCTRECQAASLELLEMIDTNEDPCNDFFRYTCGKMIDKWKLAGDYNDTASMDHKHARDNDEKMLALLQIHNPNQPAPIENIQRFYKSCWNHNDYAVNREMIFDEIDHLGGMPLLNASWEGDCGRHHMAGLLGMVQRLVGFSLKTPFFEIKLNEEVDNGEPPIVIDQFLKGYTQKEILDFITSLTYKSKYNIPRGVGYYTDEMKQMLKDLVIFAEDVSEIESKEDEMTTMEDVQQLINFIDWSSYWAILSANNANYSHDNVTVKLDRGSAWALSNLMDPSNTDCSTKINYIWMVTIMQLSGQYRFEMEYFSSLVIDPNKDSLDEQRVKENNINQLKAANMYDCIEIAMDAMPHAAGALYISQMQNADRTRQTIQNITEDIILVMQDIVTESNLFVEQKTKDGVIHKLSNIDIKAGFPDMALNTNLLNKYYKDLTAKFPTDNNYMKMIFAVNGWRLDNKFKDAHHPTKVWPSSPAKLTAFYMPGKNRVFLPIANFGVSPFFWKQGAEAEDVLTVLNYGTAGLTIAHEINHAFTDDGPLYDPTGRVSYDWWDPQSHYNYNTRAWCLRQQYSRIKVFDWHINGNQTIGENIADNGGIKAAYRAYTNFKGNRADGRRLEFLDNITYDQMFFIGAVGTFCSNKGWQAMEVFLQQDTHSPPEQRMNTMLQNLEEFSAAFQCKIGTNMNPWFKCKWW